MPMKILAIKIESWVIGYLKNLLNGWQIDQIWVIVPIYGHLQVGNWMDTDHFHNKYARVAQKLLNKLRGDISRSSFFKTLAKELRQIVTYDRLVINLYDSADGTLTYFTSAAGAVISSLAQNRAADSEKTVAGRAIACRKPVIITDLASSFPGCLPHPLLEAGLTTTMAFPLLLNNQVIATLHCSFLKEPAELYGIVNFLSEMSPVIAVCLGAILASTREEYFKQPGISQKPQNNASFVCQSPLMQKLFLKIKCVARLGIPLLVLGETGTGKTCLARLIHNLSPRSDKSFVAINCPSLSSSLFESELFGHAKGAFTGAINKRHGRLEMSNEGTLFLDEIGELPLDLQPKLLEVLENNTFTRIGENTPLHLDCRFIAATNINLENALNEGTFRQDLYHRLAVCELRLPPLRQRKEDIPELIKVLGCKLAKEYGLAYDEQLFYREDGIMEELMLWPWPGNIRELRNVILQIMVLKATREKFTLKILRNILTDSVASGQRACQEGPDLSLASLERAHIEKILRMTNGKIGGTDGAAEILGINRSTLQHRMKKLGCSITEGI